MTMLQMFQEQSTWLIVCSLLYILNINLHETESGTLSDAAHTADIVLIPQPTISQADPLVRAPPHTPIPSNKSRIGPNTKNTGPSS